MNVYRIYRYLQMQGKHQTALFHKQWTGIETFTKVYNPKEGIIGIITIRCLPENFVVKY